jgi:hypothetical protein
VCSTSSGEGDDVTFRAWLTFFLSAFLGDFNLVPPGLAVGKESTPSGSSSLALGWSSAVVCFDPCVARCLGWNTLGSMLKLCDLDPMSRPWPEAPSWGARGGPVGSEDSPSPSDDGSDPTVDHVSVRALKDPLDEMDRWDQRAGRRW